MSSRRATAPAPAYVLHRYDWSESSLILDLFSRDQGRITVAAKGAKRPYSQLRPVLLPFQRLLVVASRPAKDEAADILTLRSAEWAGGQPMLGGSALFSGFYLNELLMKLLARHDPHPLLFDAYAATLPALGAADDTLTQAALRAFEIVLLREIGLLPQLDEQTASGLAVAADAPYQLRPELGLVAWQQGEAALPGARWAALQQALDHGALAELQALCAQALPALKTTLRGLLHYHLGSPRLRTRDVMIDAQQLMDAPAPWPPRRHTMNPLVAPEAGGHSGAGTALSVNLNKVALLRNTRHLGIPSVTRAADIVLKAGAQGITVHPRPDERHIRGSDVHELAELLRPGRRWNTTSRATPAQPDGLHPRGAAPPGHLRARHGGPVHLRPRLEPAGRCPGPEAADRRMPRAGRAGQPVHGPAARAMAPALGADRVELYTESWAAAWGTPAGRGRGPFAAAGQAALAAGLGVNAGHDLNRDNLADFLRLVPGVQEVSIGHALIADALELGYDATVRAYLACIRQVQPRA
jgi:DNA repair protein RecO